MSAPLIEARGLTKTFAGEGSLLGRARPAIRAVDDVSFAIAPGEALGLVGESGSGKTTVGRALLRLTEPSAGRILFEGVDVAGLGRRAFQPYRRRMQMVFQDPFASLNPRMTVERILAEPFEIHGLASGADRRSRIAALMDRVGLGAQHLGRYPHEFSGGQRQRIVIARALASAPAFIVADEPVSALDLSVQAQIVNLLAELKRDLGLAMLFISHDLSVVEYVCDRVVVLYLGRVMEAGPVDSVFERPRHPYTEALLAAAPAPDPDAPRRPALLQGDIPSPANPPSGCVFRTRCRYVLPACAEERPPLRTVGAGHQTACLREDVP